MECNMDEAKIAMDIAKRMITEKDYNGAKIFANKAQNLFPELDGLKKLLAAVDVYISGEKKICGEADWYGILGVDPFANDEAVKKQYHKLALMLHPDKNPCNSAVGAFKLVVAAWTLLSDKDKRFSYNIKRGKEAQQRFPTTQSGIPPHQPTSDGIQNVKEHVGPRARARSTPAARMDRSHVRSSAFVSSMPEESSTFWTKCNNCNTQYEFERVYLSRKLLCPTCSQAFVAEEKPTPSNVLNPPVNLSSYQQHRSSKNQASNKKSSGPSSRKEPAPSVNHNFHWDSSSRMAGSNSQNATNQAANVVQQAQVKRDFGESQETDAARGFTNSDLRNVKRQKTDDSHMHGQLAGNQTGARNVGNGNTETPNTIGSRHSHLQGKLLPCDTKARMERGQIEIFKRLPKMISEMEKRVRATEGEKKSMKTTSEMSDKANEVERSVDEEKGDEVNTIIVPDSDFHNFDLDRSENSFKDDQIWAAYEADEGMPRLYARIQKVISLNPFKMKISWLNSTSTSEFGPIDWIGAGFGKTCGNFRSGRYESSDTLNIFSHKVDFTNGARGVFHILPKKGQVWALYRNWSPEWDKNTPDEVKHKYEMGEVLDGYTKDKQSVTVTLLLKAEGFRAVFRRSTDENDVREIAKEEMFRFSHQVPYYILTGKEADKAPEGCLELDPAATPCELSSENAEANGKSEAVKEKSSVAEEEADNLPEVEQDLAATPWELYAEANEKREAAKEKSSVPEEEADKAPEGCLELDQAATPCELSSENAVANEKSEAVKEKSSVPEEETDILPDLELDLAATPWEFYEEANEKSEAVKEKSSVPEEEVGMDLD